MKKNWFECALLKNYMSTVYSLVWTERDQFHKSLKCKFHFSLNLNLTP